MAGRNSRVTQPDIKSTIKECIKELLSDEEFIAKVADKVASKVEKKLKELEEKVAMLEDDNYKLNNKIVEMEQFSRRNNIRIFGITEENAENPAEKVITFFKEKLATEINVNQLETCHRIGNGKDVRRPLFVKFMSHATKTEIIKKRKLLKGSKIIVVEDLTKKRYELFKATVQKCGKTRTWTSNGKVMVKMENEIFTVNSMDDLDQFE